jgi:hypothetical protein
MPVYKILLNKAKADRLHAQLKQHYHSQAGLLRLALQAARDLICITEEYGPDALHPRTDSPSGFFRRLLNKDT